MNPTGSGVEPSVAHSRCPLAVTVPGGLICSRSLLRARLPGGARSLTPGCWEQSPGLLGLVAWPLGRAGATCLVLGVGVLRFRGHQGWAARPSPLVVTQGSAEAPCLTSHMQK